MRFALYYIPAPSSLLYSIGCKWLGSDVFTRKKVTQDYFSGINPDRLHDLTGTPRRYGLHATLKAPFRLADGVKGTDLRFAMQKFSNGYTAFFTSPLVIRQLNGFFCLCPAEESVQLNTLAAACVRNFDVFRAPPSRIEIARRRAEELTVVEKQYLAEWGYPYVLDRFRFHMTLTGRIADASEKRMIHTALLDAFAPILEKPLKIEAISLSVEPAPGQPFVFTDRFLFKNANQSVVTDYYTATVPFQTVNG
ncbi:MAG: DUF1045 domain-containing protein [Desulfocapsa sp.]|nr:DUF1045 domain-containing protein [Desulfocapsa sp.]